jgi:hypothetical protein
MIFILNESVINGSMNVFTTGIEADSFEAAKKKVKQFSNFHSAAVIDDETKHLFIYHIDNGKFPVHSFLNNVPLKVI